MITDTESSSPIGYIVCMPIQPSPLATRGVKGALLLGFSSPPDIPPRRAAGIAALCSMLSETLAHSSPAVICSVETMIGRHPGCACCSPDSDDEMELENEDVDADPCDDNGPGRKDRGGPPRQSLLIPIEEGDDEGRRSGDSSANSTPPRRKGNKGEDVHPLDSMKSDKIPSIAVAAAAAAVAVPTPAPASCMAMPKNTTIASGGYKFSKPVTASVTRESLRSRQSLILSYTDPALENEFAQWFQDRLRPVDFLFSMLVVTSMILLAYCRSDTGASSTAVWSHFVTFPLLFPVLLASFCSRQLHQRLRETMVALVRLYLVIAASKSAVTQLHAAQQQSIGVGSGTSTGSATETAASFLACWIASGGETLFTPAFGLQMRMKWHLPLQTAAVALMCRNVQSICEQSFYEFAGFSPQGGLVNYLCTVVSAGLLGLVLPTVMLRASEMKSRQQFEAQIAAAAGI